MEINMPDSALAIVDSLTAGLCGHVARISLFISRREIVGMSSMSMMQKSLISASFLAVFLRCVRRLRPSPWFETV